MIRIQQNILTSILLQQVFTFDINLNELTVTQITVIVYNTNYKHLINQEIL